MHTPRNALGFLAALLSLLGGCASTVGVAPTHGDAATDTTPTPDVMTTPDVMSTPDAARAECINVRECAARTAPSGALFSRSWSCVLGDCTWEPRGGQTCYPRPDGCVLCDSGAELTCPGAPCRAPLDPDAIRIESTNCSRDFFRSIASCAGRFVRLSDGVSCLLTEAPTGAIRYVLSCGPCEVVFTPR